MGDLNIVIAFSVGVLSFISPCCLPLYPAFLSYVTGISVADLKESRNKISQKTMLHTFFFLVGFSIIFVMLGLSTTYLYSLFYQYIDFIRRIGAILIIAFGLITVGIWQPKFLMVERKINFKNRPTGYFGSILIGMGYASGWTPCIGPILGSVISLGLFTGQGVLYMVAYVLGFSIPFFTMSFFIGKSRMISKHSYRLVHLGGYLSIIMGIVLFFDWMAKITSFFTNHIFRGFTGF